jgi:hypothetical protein
MLAFWKLSGGMELDLTRSKPIVLVNVWYVVSTAMTEFA